MWILRSNRELPGHTWGHTTAAVDAEAPPTGEERPLAASSGAATLAEAPTADAALPTGVERPLTASATPRADAGALPTGVERPLTAGGPTSGAAGAATLAADLATRETWHQDAAHRKNSAKMANAWGPGLLCYFGKQRREFLLEVKSVASVFGSGGETVPLAPVFARRAILRVLRWL